MWPENFIREEKTLRLTINNEFGIEMSEDEFIRIRRTYLLSRLDYISELQSHINSSKENIYKYIFPYSCKSTWCASCREGVCHDSLVNQVGLTGCINNRQ
jgi:hypothetical protein